jgi:hypothetical protein
MKVQAISRFLHEGRIITHPHLSNSKWRRIDGLHGWYRFEELSYCGCLPCQPRRLDLKHTECVMGNNNWQ